MLGDYGSTSASRIRCLPMMTDPLEAVDGTPLGPIATGVSNGIRRAAAGSTSTGRCGWSTSRAAARCGSKPPTPAQRRSGRGSGGDGVTYYWPSARMRIDGNIAPQGGGLPTARMALCQPRSGAPMSGAGDIAPYGLREGGLRWHRPLCAGRAMAGPRSAPLRCSTGRPAAGSAALDSRSPAVWRGALRFRRACLDASFASFQMGPSAGTDSPAPLPGWAGDRSIRAGAVSWSTSAPTATARASRAHGPIAVRARRGPGALWRRAVCERHLRCGWDSRLTGADQRGSMARNPRRERHLQRRQRDHRPGAAEAQRGRGEWRVRDGGDVTVGRPAARSTGPIRPNSIRCAATMCISPSPMG